MLESFEGYVNHCYDDPVGNPTCCYGHLGCPYGNGGYSQSQCESLLKSDLTRFEQCVKDNVAVTLNSNQFSALVDFAYNLGCGTLQDSTLLRVLNSGNYDVCSYIEEYVYASGVKLPGLVRRRAAECKLFSTGSSGIPSSPSNPPSSGSAGSGGSCKCASLSNCLNSQGGNECFSDYGCNDIGTCVKYGGGNACYLKYGCNVKYAPSTNCNDLSRCLAGCGGNTCFAKYKAQNIETCLKYDGGKACFAKFGCQGVSFSNSCGTLSSTYQLSSTQGSEKQSSSNNGGGAMMAAVFGLIGFVVLVAAFVTYRKRRAQKSRQEGIQL